MGSVPVQQWKLLLAAIATGTFPEAIALMIIREPVMSDDGGLGLLLLGPSGGRPVLDAVPLLPQHRQVARPERETVVEAQPVTGAERDRKVDEVRARRRARSAATTWRTSASACSGCATTPAERLSLDVLQAEQLHVHRSGAAGGGAPGTEAEHPRVEQVAAMAAPGDAIVDHQRGDHLRHASS